MKVACIQLNTGTDVGNNIEDSCTRIREAAKAGATLVMTPEMTHLLDRDADRLNRAITTQDEDLGVKAYGALARELSIHIHVGSLAIRVKDTSNTDGRAANRAFMFGPGGEIIATYDKIHMFDVNLSKDLIVRESAQYRPGNRAVIAEIGDIKIGLSICYDVRFPALYRHYGQAGVDILAIPAAFTKPTGKAHWETLLRARAIENGAYVCAAAQGGVHQDGRKTWGHSMIIDPWGNIIVQLPHDEPGYVLADIDSASVKKARERIPSLTHDRTYST